MFVLNKPPTLYLWIHYKLLEKNSNTMSSKCVVEVIRRNIRLPPKQLDHRILSELESYSLIYRINKKMGYRINQDRFLYIDPFF